MVSQQCKEITSRLRTTNYEAVYFTTWTVKEQHIRTGQREEGLRRIVSIKLPSRDWFGFVSWLLLGFVHLIVVRTNVECLSQFNLRCSLLFVGCCCCNAKSTHTKVMRSLPTAVLWKCLKNPASPVIFKLFTV